MDKESLIGHRIYSLANQINRCISDSSAAYEGCGTITGMQARVIFFIAERGDKIDTFQRDIENEFNIRRSTASGILQLMEKNDLIKRLPTEQDARLKKIVLTDIALRARADIARATDMLDKALSSGLTPDERDAFFSITGKIMENAKRAEGSVCPQDHSDGGII